MVGFAAAQTAQQVPHARGSVGDTKVTFNDCCNACESPARCSQAMGTWTLRQEGGELLALLGGKLWGAARMLLSVEAGVSLVVKGIAPSTDGAGRSAHLARHLAEAPPGME